jgi:hypothetical protein
MTNTQFVDIDEIRKVQLPMSSSDMRKYQAIAHLDVIDSIKEELDRRGISIVKENYKLGRFGQQVFGNFITDVNVDNEMSASITFTNSYDKTKRLECISSCTVLVCSNGMMRNMEISGSRRKHVGAINVELASMIDEAMDNMEMEYKMLIEAKNHLKQVEVDMRRRAEIAGRLFMEKKILSVTQMSVFKNEFERATNPFNDDSAWTIYMNATQALKLSHPVDYIKDHQKLHEFAMEVF